MEISMSYGGRSSRATHALDTSEWNLAAACRTEDPDIFYADRHDKAGISAAKSVCKSCPVSSLCLEDAIRTGQRFGIWGGMTTQERDRLARSMDKVTA